MTGHHNNPDLMRQAYDAWCKDSELAKDASNRAALLAALEGYEDFEPDPRVAMTLRVEASSPHYEQLYRDRLVTDYLVTKVGMSQKDGINLWADWEDYEYDLLHNN